MVPQVTQRLFLYLAAFLVALLPLEATYAANGCAPVTAMTDHGSDCGDCMYDERRQCQTYCLALCQSLPASRASFLEACDLSSLSYLPLLANFPPVPWSYHHEKVHHHGSCAARLQLGSICRCAGSGCLLGHVLLRPRARLLRCGHELLPVRD
jgi:hypothetical protein